MEIIIRRTKLTISDSDQFSIFATPRLLSEISREITLIKVTHNAIIGTVFFFAKRKRGAAFQRGAAALTSIA